MPELISFTILFIVGVVAGIINIMAGGGSTLTLPALIFLGVDPSVANGTNRIAILMQNVSALASFKRDKVTEIKKSLKYALLTIPGVIAGGYTAVKISDDLFEKILAVVLIFIIFSFIFKPKSLSIGEDNKYRNWILYPSFILIGFYGGFIQVGVGFLIMGVLYHLSDMTLLKVNVHKVFIILFYTVFAIVIFNFSGNINWFLGIGLAAGNTVGGFFGAKFTVKGGEKYIKYALVAAVIIIVLKLLNIV
ncbi:MAG: sulfite exporter TauE/SafE family protein [Thermodesulfobacteriota bacterium]